MTEESVDQVQGEEVNQEIENFKATGELDLPGDDDDEEEEEEESEEEVEEAGLDDYYRELGIEPSVMKKGKEGKEKKHAQIKEDEDVEMYTVKKKVEKKGEVIEAMLEKARKEPSY